MKRSLLILLLISVTVLGAYIVSPLFGQSDRALSHTLTRAATVFVLVPLGLFYVIHPTAHLNKKRRSRIDLLLGIGGIAVVISLVMFARDILVPASVTALLSLVSLYFARRLWLRTMPTPKELIVQAGETILAGESDTSERRRFASALERFKKP